MVSSVNWLDNVTIGYWNIDGLFTNADGQRSCKLDNIHFQQKAEKCDIFCLVETHCGPSEPLLLDGYRIFHNHRPKTPGATRHFGGIAIGIKNHIRPGIKILPTTNSEISWIKLCKKFFNFEKDVYLAAAYISPAGSSFTGKRDDLFEILEADVGTYSKLGDCFICGDFNARTMCEPDYCIEELSDNHINLPNDYLFDIPLRRNNMDAHVTDAHGKSLLTLCRTSGLRLLNGRTVGDILGHCTCFSHNGQPSTIDYMLGSFNLLSHFSFFHVHDPSELSIHCMLTTNLKCNAPFQVHESGNLDPLPSKYLWTKNSEEKFQFALNSPEIQKQIHSFLSTSAHTLSTEQAVEAVNGIISAAAETAGIKKSSGAKRKRKSNRKSKNKNKLWYDKDCVSSLKELRTLSTKLRKTPYDMELLQRFRSARKKYKKLL
jgi:exonuclease III